LAPVFEPGMARETARRTLERAFEAAALDAAALDARVLLCAALGIDHAGLVRDPQHLLGAAAGLVQSFADRRLRREPVSRILGYKEFWGVRFALDPAVLDPRPDTETLVEALLRHASGEPRLERKILDLGIGSGAILCALLQNFAEAFGVGVDLSPRACAVARDNLISQGVASRALVVCGNWASRFAADMISSCQIRLTSSAMKSRASLRKSASMILFSPSTAGRTVCRPIGLSFRPFQVSLRRTASSPWNSGWSAFGGGGALARRGPPAFRDPAGSLGRRSGRACSRRGKSATGEGRQLESFHKRPWRLQQNRLVCRSKDGVSDVKLCW